MANIVPIDRTGGHEADAHLAAIVDSSFDAIISKDLNSIIRSWNGAAERMFGYNAEEMAGTSMLSIIPEHLQGEEKQLIDRIRNGDRVVGHETMRRRKDGTLVPISMTVSPILGHNGEIVGASTIARDISAARDSERRIRLLMREVNHRVKNQFAVILSMVRETVKRSIDPADFEIQIRERIMALSRSHDLLVNSEWAGASLFELVTEHLRPFGHVEQISLAGPLVTLQPNAVQYLGMAFHELGTNSAKYGALSGTVGRIDLNWSIGANSAGDRELTLLWEETSVPRDGTAEGAGGRGFGSVVLRRVTPEALRGTAVLEHRPGYVKWMLVSPLDAAIELPPTG